MTRPIDADALKELKFPNGESEYATGWNDAISAIMTFQPTIEAEPVRHGKWIYGQEVCWEHMGITPVSVQYRYWECSMCGYRTKNEPIWKYCPNCGARMDEGDEIH